MQIFTTVRDLKSYVRDKKKEGYSIGFVPTMGALHQGHLSLIEQASQENDIVICSIYVNPAQFNNQDDLQKYPRTLEKDKDKLTGYDNVQLFLPTNQEMYPQEPKISFNFGYLEHIMEGKHRPGHFNGVGIIITKFLHLVQPTKTYFGQKDLQQSLIIDRLIKDLSFEVELVICPTVREKDGLAMSSRNQRLDKEQRGQASKISEVLFKAKEMFLAKNDLGYIQQTAVDFLKDNGIKLEYFHIVDQENLKEIHSIEGVHKVAICMAGYIAEIRLLDNVLLEI